MSKTRKDENAKKIKAKFSLGDVIQYIKWESNEVWQGTIVGIMLSEKDIDGNRHIEYEIAVGGKSVIKPEIDCYTDEIEARKEVIKHLKNLITTGELIIQRLEKRRRSDGQTD